MEKLILSPLSFPSGLDLAPSDWYFVGVAGQLSLFYE